MRTFIILVVLSILFSCKKTETQSYDVGASDSSVVRQVEYVPLPEDVKAFAENNTPQSPSTDFPRTAPTVYNFVVFESVTNYTKEKATLVTAIFESTGHLSEEEKYREMDKFQSENKVSFSAASITSRYLKSYNSYSEASKAREDYLGIRPEKSYSQEAVTTGEGSITK